MFSKVKHIHALTNIRRERILSSDGYVIVRRMQKVTPTDVIVAAPLSTKYLLLEIAQGIPFV